MLGILSALAAYGLGFLYSVLVGHLLVTETRRALHQGIGDKPRLAYQGAAVGLVERVLYTWALVADHAGLVPVWLGLKVAGGWHRWSKDSGTEGGSATGWPAFNVFLISAGLSVLHAAVGAHMICLWRDLGWTQLDWGILVALAACEAHIVLNKWLRAKSLEEAESALATEASPGDTKTLNQAVLDVMADTDKAMRQKEIAQAIVARGHEVHTPFLASQVRRVISREPQIVHSGGGWYVLKRDED